MELHHLVSSRALAERSIRVDRNEAAREIIDSFGYVRSDHVVLMIKPEQLRSSISATGCCGYPITKAKVKIQSTQMRYSITSFEREHKLAERRITTRAEG